MTSLEQLAALAGIAPGYRDAWGNHRTVPPETVRALLSAMGFPCATEAQLAESLDAAETLRRAALLPPVAIVLQSAPQPEIVLALPEEATRGTVEWMLLFETGEAQQGVTPLDEMRIVAREPGGVRVGLRLPAGLPLGYHALELRLGARRARTTLIVAPERCFLPDALGDGARVWALTTQVYSLRSARNWGIGDFTDLGTLAVASARQGAAALGVNPLHALFPAEPRHISPYSPSSRLWLNDLYIDPEAVPELEPGDIDAAALEVARASAQVDHPAVAAAKRAVFERLHQRFRARGGERLEAFRRFRQEQGTRLGRFATFQALHEHALAAGLGFDWHGWPAALRDPDSAELRDFASAHAERVELFEYLQWEADRQLGEAARRGHEAGLGIGLYRDLAVGVDPCGAEAWGDQELLVPGAAIGAPPDPLSLKGQNWGLVPLSPVALRRRAYEPFVAALRANMRHAGVLRIDHVMALAHLYWVPSGAEATQGAYVDYRLHDLLAILALESQRQHCAVIGEDLGTVPAGFRETMAAANVFSYRVLMFERRDDGSFIAPADYPGLASASVATHDLPTLKGYWLGRDIEWRERLNLYPDEAARSGDRQGRARERRLLLDALVREGVLPHGRRAEFLPEDESPVYGPDLAEAVHRYLALSGTRFMLVQIEDAIGEEEQANLPGTVDEHPNWRRKLSLPLEKILDDPLLKQLAQALGEARRTRR